MRIKMDGFTPAQIEGFRTAQRKSFALLTDVAAQLREGWSERAAVKLMFEAFADHGVDRFFHVPVALFGARTALPEPWELLSFGPTSARIAPGTAVVLDASPLIGEYLVDTSYSWCFGDDPVHADLRATNLSFRASILESVRHGRAFQSIAEGVDAELHAQGLVNCHRLHPEAVLGHRVLLVEDDTTPAPVDGFHPAILDWFIREIDASAHDVPRSPTWNAKPTSGHLPSPGLWAVEPHIARDGIGVKWEELLVIGEDGSAEWLDDDVPHVRQLGPAAKLA